MKRTNPNRYCVCFLKNIMRFNYSKRQVISNAGRNNFLCTKQYTYFTVCRLRPRKMPK